MGLAKARPNYFFNKLINDWNNLPAIVVNANSVNNFKSLIDNHFLDSIDLVLPKFCTIMC